MSVTIWPPPTQLRAECPVCGDRAAFRLFTTNRDDRSETGESEYECPRGHVVPFQHRAAVLFATEARA